MTTSSAPELREAPPVSAHVTDYDLALANHYRRLLVADAEGASWAEAARLVLGLDSDGDKERALRVHHAHLERARWMTREGYKDLLRR